MYKSSIVENAPVYFLATETEFAQSISWVLKQERIVVVHFSDQEHLMNEILLKRPALVLFGINQYNEADYYDFIYEMRIKMSHAPIPFFIISKLGGWKEVNKGLKAGALDYFEVPFNSILLTLKITNYLKFKMLT